MTADGVLEVLDVLADAGIRVWVDGGWGVDALLGEQTRAHNDLDIAISHLDAVRFRAAIGAAGFALYRDDGPANWVMRDGRGLEVDVHLVDFEWRVVRGGVEYYGPRGLAYETGAFGGEGTIGGRWVACCTAEFQVRSHSGYPVDEDDAHDVMALCGRFGIPLPAEYERFATLSAEEGPGVTQDRSEPGWAGCPR